VAFDRGFTDERFAAISLLLCAGQQRQHLQFAAVKASPLMLAASFSTSAGGMQVFSAINLADALQHVFASRVLEEITLRSALMAR